MPLKRIHRKVSGSVPANWMRATTKKIFLPGFRGLPLYDVARFFWNQVRKVGLTERTSAISFNFIMAIPPMIIFFFTLIPYLPISKEFIKQLYGLIREVIPGKNILPMPLWVSCGHLITITPDLLKGLP